MKYSRKYYENNKEAKYRTIQKFKLTSINIGELQGIFLVYVYGLI